MTSIIILAHGQLALTRKCIASVVKHTDVPYRLILVDNGSTGGIPAYFRSLKKRPNVKVITNKTNLGFAAGVNAGIRASRGEDCVLLNNDTKVGEGWLRRLLAVAASDPTIGAVGPLSNNVSGPQMAGDEHYATPQGLDLWARYIARIHAGKVEDTPRLVFFCVLLKAGAIKAIGGGLDPRYGQGMFEDDDACLAMRVAGYRLVIARDVWCHHEASSTFKALRVDVDGLMARNQALFLEKWQEMSRGR